MSDSKASVTYVVGLMSGTSLDGIDAALVELSEQEDSLDLRLCHFVTVPYSTNVKDKLMELCIPNQANIVDISTLNMLLGELFAKAALTVINEAGLTNQDIKLISSHGQTIFHQPEPMVIDGHEVISTLQIGDISMIAERTGILTVGDFRPRDMAAGGQGAPLVPYVDHLLFKEKDFGRALVNIGGISNITVIPINGAETEVVAYDTGPGNMIIDMFTNWITSGKQTYDKDGAIAAKGKVNETWLNQILEHEYFTLAPPKSTGRELFGKAFAIGLWEQAEGHGINDLDKLATVTALTAKTIAAEISRNLESKDIREVLVSGGGSYNKTLMKMLADFLPDDIVVDTTEYLGMPQDAKEAIAFAILGYQCYMQRTNNLPSATGATHPVVMGKMAW